MHALLPFLLLNLVGHKGEICSLNSFAQELEAWVPVLAQPLCGFKLGSHFFKSCVVLEPSLNLWASITLIYKTNDCCVSFQF